MTQDTGHSTRPGVLHCLALLGRGPRRGASVASYACTPTTCCAYRDPPGHRARECTHALTHSRTHALTHSRTRSLTTNLTFFAAGDRARRISCARRCSPLPAVLRIGRDSCPCDARSTNPGVPRPSSHSSKVDRSAQNAVFLEHSKDDQLGQPCMLLCVAGYPT